MGITIVHVDLKNMADSLTKIQQLKWNVERLRDVVIPLEELKVARAAVEHAQLIAPKRTGEYASSIHLEFTEEGIDVIAGAPHSSFVEWSTRPHIITARYARALRFIQGGQVRFAHSVFHPGTKGQLILAQAVSHAERQLLATLESTVDRTLQQGTTRSFMGLIPA